MLADETRPFFQGARLTAWELDARRHPGHRHHRRHGRLAHGPRARSPAWSSGADRIAANGDVANKIGTYGVAVLARHHGIPFYVAAPWSTIDLATASGADIPIEERDPEEVPVIHGQRIGPRRRARPSTRPST